MTATAVTVQLHGTLNLNAAPDTEPDAPPRISGVLLSYGTTSDLSGTGQRVRVTRDAVRLPEVGVPLMREHEHLTAAAGVLTELSTEGDELLGSFTLLDTSTGRDTLAELRAGVRTELSVGLRVLDHELGADGELVVLDSELVEVSQVLRGAMPGARVTDVAANRAAAPPPEETVTDTAPTVSEPSGTVAAPVLLTATDPAPAPSAGEYLYALLNRHREPERFAALAAPHTLIGDTPGLLPTSVIAPVVSLRDAARPLFERLGARQGPLGKSFLRPVITDPLADATTAAEKTDVTDQLRVTEVEVTYEFIKRAVNLSAEAITATSPEVLQVAADDLGRAYMRGAEVKAAAALLAADDTPTVAGNLGAIYAAAAAQYGATGRLPDTLAVGPAAWAAIAPQVPVINVQNGNGTNVGAGAFDLTLAGMRVVVSWALPGTVGYLFSTELVESWERSRVEMRADEPTILGTALGIGGAVAVKPLSAAAVTALNLATFTPTGAAPARKG